MIRTVQQMALRAHSLIPSTMPHSTPLRPLEKAAVALKVVVVGGNIGGLAAANAMKLAGHDVVAVVEKSDGRYQSRGSIQSPPGMTRSLCRWGLEKNLEQLAHKCSLLIFRNGGTNEMIGSITMDKDFLEDLLAEFLFIQHQDLRDLLYGIVVDAGIPVLFNTEVTDVKVLPTHACATLDNGQSVAADFIIAADGYNSMLRPKVTNVPDEEAMTPHVKHLHLTFKMPTELLVQHEDLHLFLQKSLWPLWMGSGYTIHTNITTDGQFLASTLTYDWDHELLPEDHDWVERPIEYYRLDMERFEEPLRKLLGLVKTVSARIIVTRPAPDDLVCGDSRIVLVGEAAHPLLPGANHRTSMVIEDAETLRSIFSRLQQREQLSQFLTAYEEIRAPRCKSVVAYDQQFHRMVRCPAGLEMQIRDEMLRQSMVHGDWDHMDEAAFRMVWSEELMMYAFDATEQVDSYWTHWVLH
ncbi:FAD/NAD(P)-binding domain-containing protein [Pholiota conissans]|uniref:FAD/NAD(P)-binding domain-containing protein n=1 Tax=Pholiota conissans TaxID=109636 RepID=A0A9P6CXT0_9AGAR|nr:FAD/NAD(P)-binding domain-containing protein [Pholiota conissans]